MKKQYFSCEVLNKKVNGFNAIRDELGRTYDLIEVKIGNQNVAIEFTSKNKFNIYTISSLSHLETNENDHGCRFEVVYNKKHNS